MSPFLQTILNQTELTGHWEVVHIQHHCKDQPAKIIKVISEQKMAVPRMVDTAKLGHLNEASPRPADESQFRESIKLV